MQLPNFVDIYKPVNYDGDYVCNVVGADVDADDDVDDGADGDCDA